MFEIPWDVVHSRPNRWKISIFGNYLLAVLGGFFTEKFDDFLARFGSPTRSVGPPAPHCAGRAILSFKQWFCGIFWLTHVNILDGTLKHHHRIVELAIFRLVYKELAFYSFPDGIPVGD